MIVFSACYVYKRLNRVKNISLYDLSINLNTQKEECDIKMKFDDLRSCDVHIENSTLFLINTRCL